jgi:hypothetical protein
MEQIYMFKLVLSTVHWVKVGVHWMKVGGTGLGLDNTPRIRFAIQWWRDLARDLVSLASLALTARRGRSTEINGRRIRGTYRNVLASIRLVCECIAPILFLSRAVWS